MHTIVVLFFLFLGLERERDIFFINFNWRKVENSINKLVKQKTFHYSTDEYGKTNGSARPEIRDSNIQNLKHYF